MMLYMVCFAMLFVSFSGLAYTRDLSWKPTNVTDSPGCGFRKYTQTDYTTNTTNGLVQFIYREYDRYHGPQWGPDDAILEYPWLDEWTILEARIAGTCNVVQQCSLIRSCSDMVPTPNSTDAEMRYALLTAVENLANYLNIIKESLQSASTFASGKLASMMKTFSWDQNVAGYRAWEKAEAERKLAMTFAIIDTVTSMVAIGLAQPELLGAGKVINSAFRGTAGDAQKAAQVLMNRFKDGASTLKVLSSSYDRIGGRERDVVNMLDRIQVPIKHVSLADFESAFADYIAELSHKLVLNGETLLRGNNLTGRADDEFNLASILSTGNFAEPVNYLASAVETIFQTILTASLIDTYWSREQVYIYMTEGDCKTSYRGPDVNKVCLDEYPGYMFWINSLPRYQEMSKTKISSLDVPPGWHELAGEGYAGVNQMMVMRSAVSAFMRAGKNVALEHEQNLTRSFIDDPVSTLAWTPARAGVFNIGVCYDPNGKFVSSLNIQEGRNYPCECHPAPGADSSISYVENYAGFLDVTGFSTSRDHHQGCLGKKDHHDRQRCDEDRVPGKELAQWYRRTDKKYLNPKGRDQSGTDCFAETAGYPYKNCGVVGGVQSGENQNLCGQGQCKKKDD